MRLLMIMTTAVCVVVLSCTKDKTDYEAEIDTVVTEHLTFKEAARFEKEGYAIRIASLNGTFYKGYNEIRVSVQQGATPVLPEEVTCLPIFTDAQGEHTTGPHGRELVHQADSGYHASYAVFTEESRAGNEWRLYMGFRINGTLHQLDEAITVTPQPNKNLNMTSFTGTDGGRYVIALVAPQKPQVAENELVAGIYRYNEPASAPSANFPDPAQFSYAAVSGYSLHLDPRMPEPSMGNHSSPNNRDLTQQSDGLYHGLVNYTMTGNWTLNFILSDQLGKIVKGTVVPSDFTPGVQGVKSELYLDILF